MTPWSITNDTIAGSRTNACAMFTPNGLSVSVRIFLISSRIASSSPDDVSMMPSPPAFDTADASWARAIQPIGACTIGYFDAEHFGDTVLELHAIPFVEDG